MGIILGPFGTNLLSRFAVYLIQKNINRVCLTFIAVTAGLEVYLPQLYDVLTKIVIITLFISIFTTLIVGIGSWQIGIFPYDEFDGSQPPGFLANLLIGAIMIARSPTTIFAICSQMDLFHRPGNMDRNKLRLILVVSIVSDLAVLVFFTIIVSITRVILEQREIRHKMALANWGPKEIKKIGNIENKDQKREWYNPLSWFSSSSSESSESSDNSAEGKGSRSDQQNSAEEGNSNDNGGSKGEQSESDSLSDTVHKSEESSVLKHDNGIQNESSNDQQSKDSEDLSIQSPSPSSNITHITNTDSNHTHTSDHSKSDSQSKLKQKQFSESVVAISNVAPDGTKLKEIQKEINVNDNVDDDDHEKSQQTVIHETHPSKIMTESDMKAGKYDKEDRKSLDKDSAVNEDSIVNDNDASSGSDIGDSVQTQSQTQSQSQSDKGSQSRSLEEYNRLIVRSLRVSDSESESTKDKDVKNLQQDLDQDLNHSKDVEYIPVSYPHRESEQFYPISLGNTSENLSKTVSKLKQIHGVDDMKRIMNKDQMPPRWRYDNDKKNINQNDHTNTNIEDDIDDGLNVNSFGDLSLWDTLSKEPRTIHDSDDGFHHHQLSAPHSWNRNHDVYSLASNSSDSGHHIKHNNGSNLNNNNHDHIINHHYDHLMTSPELVTRIVTDVTFGVGGSLVVGLICGYMFRWFYTVTNRGFMRLSNQEQEYQQYNSQQKVSSKTQQSDDQEFVGTAVGSEQNLDKDGSRNTIPNNLNNRESTDDTIYISHVEMSDASPNTHFFGISSPEQTSRAPQPGTNIAISNVVQNSQQLANLSNLNQNNIDANMKRGGSQSRLRSQTSLNKSSKSKLGKQYSLKHSQSQLQTVGPHQMDQSSLNPSRTGSTFQLDRSGSAQQMSSDILNINMDPAQPQWPGGVYMGITAKLQQADGPTVGGVTPVPGSQTGSDQQQQSFSQQAASLITIESSSDLTQSQQYQSQRRYSKRRQGSGSEFQQIQQQGLVQGQQGSQSFFQRWFGMIWGGSGSNTNDNINIQSNQDQRQQQQQSQSDNYTAVPTTTPADPTPRVDNDNLKEGADDDIDDEAYLSDSDFENDSAIVLILEKQSLRGKIILYIKACVFVFFVLSVFLLSERVSTLTHGELHLEPLLICSILACVVGHDHQIRAEVSQIIHAFTPHIFMPFFTVTGASLRLASMYAVFDSAMYIFILRLLAIFLASYLACYICSKQDEDLRYYMGLTLMSQAGVALGLALECVTLFPQWGEGMSDVVISVVCMNQLVGPILCVIGMKRLVSVAESKTAEEEQEKNSGVQAV